MRLRRVRFTTRGWMATVAVLAVLIGIVAEVFVRKPKLLHLNKVLAHHEIRAEAWGFVGDGYEPEEEPYNECRRLGKWHRERLRELNTYGIPSDESWWKEGARMTNYEEGYFKRIGATGLLPVNYESLR